MQTYNIYCDESCHLKNDCLRTMVMGAVWCPLNETSRIAEKIRTIKVLHGLPPWFEIKWTKVTPSKREFYHDIVNYFFDEGDLHFRALVVPDKGALRHDDFQQDHDTWYYKMYFDMLKVLISPKKRYRIYIDIKDTRGGRKVHFLRKVLNTANYEFERDIIERLQIVRSHDIEQMQLADLLIGCVGYANRGQRGSETKLSLVEKVRFRSGYDLTRSTLLREQKVNVFLWHAREAQG